MKIAAVLMLLCLSLGACGQKGPLYLPQSANPQPEVSAQQAVPGQAKAVSSKSESSQASSAATQD